MLQIYATDNWDKSFTSNVQLQAVNDLECGKVLHFPQLGFTLSPEEHCFLSPQLADPRSKNISYQSTTNQLWGVQRLTDEKHMQLKALLNRFARYATHFINKLLPQYEPHLMIARTSFRPVQISGRKTSPRKDDKRLHIDAFPSAPNQGKRILRVFCNINPEGAPRLWRIGEPFEQVARRFIPQIKKPFPGLATLLHLSKITKSHRTPYDHYMLNMHDLMKEDETYQKEVSQQEMRFPAGSTWIVQTDQVSHAAIQGQYILEQTFYLPVKAMKDETRSPLRVLEHMLNRKLV